MTTPETPRLLTVKQTCEQLGISRRQFYNLIERKALKTVRMPGPAGRPFGHRVEQAEINAFIERNSAGAPTP